MLGDYIFMTRPPPCVLDPMHAAMAACGLVNLAGANLFAPENWHQSLSDRHNSSRREALLRAGARVQAAAFPIVLNRFRSSGVDPGHIHWEMTSRGAKPQGLVDLLDNVRLNLGLEGVHDPSGHTAHVTICYRAFEVLSPSIPIVPITWTVDAFELVVVEGSPYRYTTIERWPLAPPRQAALL